MFWEKIEMHKELHLLEENASKSIINNTTKVLGTAIENVHYIIENINDALTNPKKRTSLIYAIMTKFTPECIKKTDGQFEASNESSLKLLKILLTGLFVDLRQRSRYYLDKTHFISKIENLNASAILSLHSCHFGKTLFLSILSSYYDIKNQEDQFKQLFGDLFISKNPTLLASSFLVLELNFSRIRTSATYVVFEESFHKCLNLFMSGFMYQYQQELGHHFQIVNKNSDALTNLLKLLNAIELCGYKLYICIDEYDASINEILRDETVIQELTDNHKNENKIKLIESSFNEDSSNIIKKFLHFPPDLNILPSQTILELIGNNPLGKSILTEALNRSSLKSRNEFIAEALKIYNWKEEDLIPVRSCLQILEPECNIELLCRFVEETLLKPLKDNSVKHSNEEALKQSFINTLILTLYANIELEFWINSQNSNLGNKAIDLVKTSTGGRIAIEFDNIRIDYINLNRAQSTWQKATQ
ncbi:24732_t:CDS:2, partial [Cetraspora pellucida]